MREKIYNTKHKVMKKSKQKEIENMGKNGSKAAMIINNLTYNLRNNRHEFIKFKGF